MTDMSLRNGRGLANAELVSIVMPAYNTAPFIEETIRSIQGQTHTRWELIVVDDGSSDDTGSVVQALAETDARIRLISLPRNVGPGPARNVGMASASGRYLAFQDSEDLWVAGKLEQQLRFLRERDAAFVFSGYSMIDDAGRPIGRPVTVPERVDYRTLLHNTIIAMITVLVDRERVGPLQLPDLPQHEDLVMWFRVLKRGVVAHGIPDPLARYRILGNSASRNKWRSARRMWNVYRRIERLSLSDSAWCYAHYAWNAWRKYRR